jgi:hypothetical protein
VTVKEAGRQEETLFGTAAAMQVTR